jgi:hypothetical protein
MNRSRIGTCILILLDIRYQISDSATRGFVFHNCSYEYDGRTLENTFCNT